MEDAKKRLRDTCCTSDNVRNVKKLLAEHPSILNEGLDIDGSTALMIAAYYSQKKVLKYLLSLPNIQVNAQNKKGETVLYYASYYGAVDIVKLLLTHPDIDIDIKNNSGWTATDMCCDQVLSDEANKPKILKLFEKHREKKAKTAKPVVESTPSTDVVYLDNLHLEVHQLDQERESELGNRHSKDGKESVECHCIIQ